VEAGDEGGGGLWVGELPWRLNFEGFHLPKAEQDKPARWLHDCLGMLAQGPADDVAEYYQQQSELLECFNEMDTPTDHGFLSGTYKVCCVLFL